MGLGSPDNMITIKNTAKIPQLAIFLLKVKYLIHSRWIDSFFDSKSSFSETNFILISV